MNTPIASVVVPVKNMSTKMKNISSWLQQVEDLPLEIIFVDDNSTDSTFSELTDIKKHFEFLKIHLLTGEFHGPGGARNAGMSLAQGQWIAFWDSDDSPHPKVFFEMIKTAVARDLDYAVGDWIEFSNKKSDPLYSSNYIHGSKLRDLIEFPGIWRWAFKRSTIGNTRFPNLLLGEDLVFLSKLQIRLPRLYRHHEPIYSYATGNESQLTGSISVQKNMSGLIRYLKSRDFLCGKVTIFGAIIKTKLLASTIKRYIRS